MVRDGLADLLAAVPGLSIVGAASGVRAAIRLLGHTMPDVLLADLFLGDGSATELLRYLRRIRVKSEVVIMTGHGDRFAAAEALEEGARGYVLKSENTSELVAAIEAVAEGKRYVSPAMTLALRSHERPDEQVGLAKLSRRESEIFRMSVMGAPAKEIARRLFISPKTVETHRCNINRKLSLRSVADLMRFAAELGITIAPRAPSFADGHGLDLSGEAGNR